MHHVYLLKSERDHGYYIGYSEDIGRRFQQHQEEGVDSTAHRRPLELVYFEAYPSKDRALERERKLKQFGSAYKGLLKRLGF